jgi:TetR/AcrR family transcriptional regulator, transcriptional repressor for nem operon
MGYAEVMPRPRAFDVDAVRERIADVFTAHGYGGTSLAMLTEAAGLGKQSLYNALGDKQQLYLDAVECSAARFAAVQAKMARAASGRAAIEAFFAELVGACADPDPASRSCIVSAGLLEGIEDPTIAAKLREKWRATRELLREAVERGQRDGSIRRDPASGALADVLMTTMSGLRVSARAAESTRSLRATASLVLALLDPPDG